MNAKLVGSMFFSMFIGGACAGATLWSGGGFLVALGVYSLAGSVTLVPAAYWAASEQAPRQRAARPRPGAAVA